MIIETYIGMMILLLIMVVVIVLTKDWLRFGLQYFIMNWWHKGETGLVFVRNYGNNLSFPIIVSLAQSKVPNKDKPRIFTREMFTDGYFWGKPFMIVDANDMLSTYGLYKHQVDEQGRPIYEQVANKLDEQGNVLEWKRIPALIAVKNSTVLAPETLKAAIAGEAMNSNLFDLGKRIQIVLIVAGIAALCAVAAAYFGYMTPNMFHTACEVTFNNRIDQLAGQMIEVANVCTLNP